jgi:hypothetical protein
MGSIRIDELIFESLLSLWVVQCFVEACDEKDRVFNDFNCRVFSLFYKHFEETGSDFEAKDFSFFVKSNVNAISDVAFEFWFL